MIDSQREHVIHFKQASDELPRRRRGQKIHNSCWHRWATNGLRGIVLETIQVGGTRCTSREAVQRFFERLSQQTQAGTIGSRQAEPSYRCRTVAQRQRASAEAARRLVEKGA